MQEHFITYNSLHNFAGKRSGLEANEKIETGSLGASKLASVGRQLCSFLRSFRHSQIPFVEMPKCHDFVPLVACSVLSFGLSLSLASKKISRLNERDAKVRARDRGWLEF